MVSVHAMEEADAAVTISRLPGSDGNATEFLGTQELGQTCWRSRVNSHDVPKVINTHRCHTGRLANAAASVKARQSRERAARGGGTIEYSLRHCRIGRNRCGLQSRCSPPDCLRDDCLVIDVWHDDCGVVEPPYCRGLGLT
ncbi:hypothetical protein MRX96_010906 [Rhipicephalus microplus]